MTTRKTSASRAAERAGGRSAKASAASVKPRRAAAAAKAAKRAGARAKASPAKTPEAEVAQAAAAASEAVIEAERKTGEIIEQQVEAATHAGEEMAETAEKVSRLGVDAMDAVVRAGNVAATNAETVGENLMQFAQRRFEQDVNAAADLLACRSVPDWMAVQQNYLQGFFSDCVDQSAQLAEIGAKTASEVMTPFDEGMRAAFDAFNDLLRPRP